MIRDENAQVWAAFMHAMSVKHREMVSRCVHEPGLIDTAHRHWDLVRAAEAMSDPEEIRAQLRLAYKTIVNAWEGESGS